MPLKKTFLCKAITVVRVPYFCSWRMNGHFCLVWSVNEYLIFPWFVNLYFRSRETIFRFFRDPWNVHLFTRDLCTDDFCWNKFTLFLEILASLNLHQTRCKTCPFAVLANGVCHFKASKGRVNSTVIVKLSWSVSIPHSIQLLLMFAYHRFRWYATFENKTPVETFPKFPSIIHVIDRSDRNPPITAR